MSHRTKKHTFVLKLSLVREVMQLNRHLFTGGIVAGLASLALALALATQVQAAPVFFDDVVAFDAATSGLTFSDDDFNGLSTTFSSTSYNGASGLNISSNVRLRDSSSSRYCASGSCLQFSTPRGGSEQTFTFDTGSVNAFGINVGDLATVGHSTLVLETSNGDSILNPSFRNSYYIR